MRVVRDDAFIKKRIQFAQRGSLIGMGMLLVSLVLTWNGQPLISWLLLIGGFVIAMAAARVGNRYIRPPRPDKILDTVLERLDNRFTIFHYLRPAEHLVLTPSGLIAIRMQEQRGRISVRGARWRHQPLWQRLRTLLGEEGLDNPARTLRREMAETSRGLAGLQGEDGSVPIEGVILFYSGKVQLERENPEFPVLLPDELRATIRSMAEARPPLPNRTVKQLAATLGGEGIVEETEPEEPSEPKPREQKRRRKARRST